MSDGRRRLLATKPAHRCHYCRVDLTPGVDLTVDHIVPRSLGGSDCITNLAACCAPCNDAKANRRWHRECKRCSKSWRRHTHRTRALAT